MSVSGAGGWSWREGAPRTTAPPGGPHVLVVANLEPSKGHRTLFRAVEKLSGDHPGMQVHLAGRDERDGRLQVETAHNAALRERIVFHGFVPDLVPLLARAELLVHPSDGEGLPNAVMEAAACALPVVATNVGGTGELIEQGVSGQLVPAGDSERARGRDASAAR